MIFIIFAQTTKQIEPAERTFDNPAERDDVKPNGTVAALGDLNDPCTMVFEPDNELVFLSAIHQNLL